MRNLHVKKFNKSILKNAKIITSGSGFFRTYDMNNGYIIKVLKEKDDLDLGLYYQYDSFIFDLYDKLLFSRNIDVPSIVKPHSIFMKEDRVYAYTVPKVFGLSLHELLDNKFNLDLISSLICKVSEEVKFANKCGINFPDLGNATNILVDNNGGSIRFIDYEGLQIDKYPSFSISSLMMASHNKYFDKSKYKNSKNGIVTSNFDKATLYALFLYYTTHTNIADIDFYVFNRCRKEEIDNAIKKYSLDIGIDGTSMEEDIHTIFSSKSNNYPDTSIKRLVKDFQLDLISKEKAKFIRK